ncbi:hypothetical protein DPX16_21369 [Anabarilius grahami]|uniref:Uncharacterized protein n=1 Tax=Anabarilius grahami TaxID=495550 RepID=A0A3N0XEP6_ANAGA|nr:hypothetical protein DPX16_21369 [Anabarilius grahami]
MGFCGSSLTVGVMEDEAINSDFPGLSTPSAAISLSAPDRAYRPSTECSGQQEKISATDLMMTTEPAIEPEPEPAPATDHEHEPSPTVESETVKESQSQCQLPHLLWSSWFCHGLPDLWLHLSPPPLQLHCIPPSLQFRLAPRMPPPLPWSLEPTTSPRPSRPAMLPWSINLAVLIGTPPRPGPLLSVDAQALPKKTIRAPPWFLPPPVLP